MPTLYIDQKALIKNIKITKQLAGDAKIIGIVKENGYGLGLLPFSQLLMECGIETLAVSSIEEAISLRESGIRCDILLLCPLYKKTDILEAFRHDVILNIASPACGRLAEQVAEEASIWNGAHLCIDTGFGRYGFSYEDTEGILDIVKHMRHIEITGIYSHFYASACKRKKPTIKQFKRFTSLCDALEEHSVFIGTRHIAASCGLLKFPETRLDAVRIGSAFLGRLPFSNQWGYQPIGELKAAVSDIHTLPTGQGIGYGHSYIAKKKTTIAIVSAGYSHGLGVHRTMDNPKIKNIPGAICHFFKKILFPKRIYALYQDQTFPVIGKIGMNSCMIDITGTDIQIGDIVSLPVNPIFVDSSIERQYSIS